jgi:hypothetical protein
MINSFIQMVKESADLELGQDGLVDEMGVKRPERLTGSEMGTIRQSSIQHKQNQTNAPRKKNYHELVVEIVDDLKRMPRTEIVMEKPASSRYYYPKLPAAIVQKMREAYALNNRSFVQDIGNWRDLSPNDSDAIYFKLESPSEHQRSHFPNGGIPQMLRGTGLGYKLYRALLKAAGYLSSNRAGSTEKDKTWGSLLAQKTNPDGTLSVDDAHAVIGKSNWMALDKEMSERGKIDAVISFITGTIGVQRTQPDKFDIDDELLAILPDDFLVKLDPSYLQSLVDDNRITQEKHRAIEDSRSEADRRERERQAQAEIEARERRTREEAETRVRLTSRIQQFGADLDAEWGVGDYIVVKSYLFDASYNGLPIRRVVLQNGGTYIAVKISDSIRIDNGDITPNQANDNRSTSDKSQWVKVNIDQIPDLTRVNLTDAERTYLEGQMDPETAARARAEREEAERKRRETERRENEERARNRETFGSLPDNAGELKTAQTARNNGSIREADLLKKFKDSYFTDRMEVIVMGPHQREALRNSYGVPIFIAWTGSTRRPIPASLDTINNDPQLVKLTNAVTGFTVDAPFAGLGLLAYPLTEVTVDDKLRARAGTHYYISGHKNAFGILAKSDYGAVNTSAQKFIYVKAYGYGERSVSVRLDLLRKIGTPTEL